VTASLKAAGIRPAVRSHGDEVALRRRRAEIPIDDLRDLTGILLGDPWPNDYRRSREPDARSYFSTVSEA
jgi:hypothetical protein